MPTFPDPTVLHPLPTQPRVVLLKPLIGEDARIDVGEFTYYDHPEHALDFAERNVLYGYGPERLIIGRYCAIGADTRFIMAGAAHPTSGVSTFPFTIFGGEWQERTMDILFSQPSKGDTVVGNDVWFGYQSTIMPGVRIGDGAIIATGAVVTADVPPYAIVGGNPARVIRLRYDEADVARLTAAAWWDWPLELVTEHARTLMTGTPADIERIAAEAAPATSPDR
ncbi:virginiamycin A acetyltransferase [Actinoalloteichus hoggarensis]|uniref:Streptogramin A acetyltransferase n=1 Tax=Actinoalloteichus hoggarensis TaxID=1470176 RepID=A0A221W1E2_9PSEU|nr:CatB-related O-acetyltransferase [Actinoalloteichus hoggarensis]ASO19563.1 Streptogramin A acetyltransferase [Actinoalloteichus hoggarensis]MBB5919730.1 virginiamycin A acetyltransferase [Actinoalloteichus hoggarensis]